MNATDVIGYYIGSDAYCPTCAHVAGIIQLRQAPVIIADAEADSPTHCNRCERLIPHRLTPEGYSYIATEIHQYVAEGGYGRAEILLAWWDEYHFGLSKDDQEFIIDGVIDLLRNDL